MELADVIERIESSGNQYAQRFERLHLGVSKPALLAAIQAANRCSIATADVFASMSHGLYQLMGFRLYGDPKETHKNFGYRGGIVAFLNDRTLQRSLFTGYVVAAGVNFSIAELISDPAKRAKFAEEYNGPGAIADYSQKILSAIRSLAPTTPPL